MLDLTFAQNFRDYIVIKSQDAIIIVSATMMMIRSSVSVHNAVQLDSPACRLSIVLGTPLKRLFRDHPQRKQVDLAKSNSNY